MAAVRVCAAGRPPAGHFVRLGPAVCRDGVDESVPCGQKPPTPFVRSPRLNIPPIPWAKVRQRAGGLAFALVLNLLLLLALFTLSPSFQPPKMDPRLPVTFETEAGPKAAQEEAKAEKAERREESKAEPQKVEEPVVRPPLEVEKPVEQPPSPFPFLTLNREQMASAAFASDTIRDMPWPSSNPTGPKGTVASST